MRLTKSYKYLKYLLFNRIEKYNDIDISIADTEKKINFPGYLTQCLDAAHENNDVNSLHDILHDQDIVLNNRTRDARSNINANSKIRFYSSEYVDYDGMRSWRDELHRSLEEYFRITHGRECKKSRMGTGILFAIFLFVTASCVALTIVGFFTLSTVGPILLGVGITFGILAGCLLPYLSISFFTLNDRIKQLDKETDLHHDSEFEKYVEREEKALLKQLADEYKEKGKDKFFEDLKEVARSYEDNPFVVIDSQSLIQAKESEVTDNTTPAVAAT